MADRALTRVRSLRERVDETMTANRNEILTFLSKLASNGKRILQPHQLTAEIEKIPEADRKKLQEGPFGDTLKSKQEAIVLAPWVALASLLAHKLQRLKSLAS